MKLIPACSVLWSSLLILWSSQIETEHSNIDVCQEEKLTHYLQCNPEEDDYVEEEAVTDNFRCLLYPKNKLNCSWSFDTLQNDTQVFVYISTCDDERTIHSLNHSFVEKVGSTSLILKEHETLYVILQFNITLRDKWTSYTYTYDLDMLEVLSPPKDLSALIKDGDLLVTWSPPYSQVTINPKCFDYQLDMGDQEKPRNFSGQLSATLSNADPDHIYRVRIRTRKGTACAYESHWSDWSDAVMVMGSNYKLNTLAIVSISLGIPMILLAVLLLVRYQRVSMVLFPPIPCPPPKYIHILQKNDTFNVFHQAPQTEPVEEITEVEDTEPDPGSVF